MNLLVNQIFKGCIIIKNKFNQFRAIMILYWSAMVAITGMYTMYIKEIGFSNVQITLAVTIYTITGLFGQIILGYLVDKLGNIRKTIIISLSIGLISTTGLLFADNTAEIYVLLIFWGFFISSLYSLIDTWCMNMLEEMGEQRNFGKIRGFGSIGYGFSGVLLGLLLQNLGWKIYYWYIIIGLIAALFVIYLIKGNDNESQQIKINSSISFKDGLAEIIKIKPLIAMIAIIFMYNFVVKGIYSYLAILVSDFGGGVESLGFTYFFDASPEIITFFLTSRLLKKYKNKSIITAAFLLQVIRLSIIFIFHSSLSIILTGILSGFAFGLLAASYKTYIYNLSPEKYKTSSMSIAETIIGLAGIVSAPVFGFMFSKFGTANTILFGLIIEIILAFIMIINSIKPQTKEG